MTEARFDMKFDPRGDIDIKFSHLVGGVSLGLSFEGSRRKPARAVPAAVISREAAARWGVYEARLRQMGMFPREDEGVDA